MFLVLLSDCAHTGARSGSSTELSPGDYYPLAIGNRWSYRLSGPSLEPSIKAPAELQTLPPATEREVRIIEQLPDGYFRDSQKGELLASTNCLQDRHRMLLCRPFQVGNRWLSVVNVGATEHYEIVNTGLELVLPSGTFRNCLKVRAHERAAADAELIVEWTYAPDVGLVQMESFVVVKGEAKPQLAAQLTSFHRAVPTAPTRVEVTK